jgi:hypothetical protein
VEFYGNYQVYSESGVDLTLLLRNLRRSVEERLKRNSRGVRLAAELDRAGRSARSESTGVELAAMAMQEEPLIHLLTDHDVEFVLIGGLAMRVHGSAHITDDFDVCYRRTPENIARLAAAFAPMHPYLRGAPPGLPFRFDPPTIQAGLNFTLDTDLGDVDVLAEVSGIGTYEQALAQSKEYTIFGRPVQVLTLVGLIAAKKAAGRAKDRLHLLELEELKKLRDAEAGEES